MQIEKIACSFCINGNPVECREFGSGHINSTFKVVTDAGNEYMNAELEGITITVIATQDTVEVDSIDNRYDADATWETEANEVE